MSLLHSSKRRPSPLRDIDYDHEIDLVDYTKSKVTATATSNSRSLSASRHSAQSPGGVSDSESRRHSDVPLTKKVSSHRFRKEYSKRKYRKYQDRRLETTGTEDAEAATAPEGENSPSPERNAGRTPEVEERGRRKTKIRSVPESAIDILYENQRGGFLCGMPLFSSKALGNLDPSPWTNDAFKPSPTDITNAQVPDPSWEWAWKDWSINHDDGVDDDGWEYSFAFAKYFSWHGPSWWNSFVRRRAWIRKRMRKSHGNHEGLESHRLTSDYFTIHSTAMNRSRSRASTFSSRSRRYSISQVASRDVESETSREDIHDIGSLMTALKLARIDREKLEAVENFIRNSGEELVYLAEKMHDIMRMFIFQASRRLLLTHIMKLYNSAVDEREAEDENNAADTKTNEMKRRRLENLEKALGHADEEVKKLEFWSDVKDIAEKGETRGAVDEAKGWDGKRWTGLDDSGAKDVISQRKLPGMTDCEEGEGNGTAILEEADKGKKAENGNDDGNGTSKDKDNGKGKGNAKESDLDAE